MYLFFRNIELIVVLCFRLPLPPPLTHQPTNPLTNQPTTHEKPTQKKTTQNKISNEKIIVYCAGSYSKIILKLIPIYNIKIKFVCDSNLGFQNQKIYKHKIKSKKYLVKNLKKFSDNNILISNFSIKTSINIKNDLVRSGFNKNKIHCLGY